MAPSTKSDPQLAHMVYFTLKDRSPAAVDKLVAACHRYLTDHPGTVYFSVGTLADLARPVNDRQFDVALNVVFRKPAGARRLSGRPAAPPIHRRSKSRIGHKFACSIPISVDSSSVPGGRPRGLIIRFREQRSMRPTSLVSRRCDACLWLCDCVCAARGADSPASPALGQAVRRNRRARHTTISAPRGRPPTARSARRLGRP